MRTKMDKRRHWKKVWHKLNLCHELEVTWNMQNFNAFFFFSLNLFLEKRAKQEEHHLSLTPLERVIAEADNYKKSQETSLEEESSTEEPMSSEDEGEWEEPIKLNFGRLPKPEECQPDDEVSFLIYIFLKYFFSLTDW